MATTIADDFNVVSGVPGVTFADDFNSLVGNVPTTPSVPLSFVAQPGNARALLSWLPPASTGGSAVTGYRLTAVQGSVVVLARNYSADAISADVTGLNNGSLYVFSLSATNDYVNYGPVATASTSPSATVIPPGPVTKLTASVVSDTAVTLSWAAPTSGTRPNGYRIVSTPATTTVTTTSSPYVFTGLTPDTEYTFTVTPSADGVLGSYTTSSAVRTLTEAAVPELPPVVLPLPNFYAFPQPDHTTEVRVFRPANFGKTIDDVPKGD